MSEETKNYSEMIETSNNDQKENEMNELLEQFNSKCATYLKSKGIRSAKPIDFDRDALIAFAIEGFKSKVYRQRYNKNRWSQLKAIKNLAEEKGVSIEDLLNDLSE